MRRCLLIPIFLLLVYTQWAQAQCTTLGQNPSTAFPVCGTTVFEQSTVPICSSNSLFVPGCTGTDNADYENKNPFWYKFTCYESGTLGFTITPNTASDDYDWQLYDITGHNPDDVYTVQSLVVIGNWSATPGNTGASANGVNYLQCASIPSDNAPTFSRMPNITAGHQYLLLISHYTNTQSGYSLSFGGGTASITDPKLPKMDTAKAPCDGSVIVVSLNKKMKCNSISSGEFVIEPPVATVTSVTGNGCSSSFDMDKLTLTLSNPLPPGNYKVRIKNGSDANTILDNCDRGIPENDSLNLIILPVLPTPMDSLTKPGCAPQTLELVFSKEIKCNSIAPNGSDFSISGSYPVTITGASGVDCVDGLTSKIIVQLSAPLLRAGNFQIRLVQGNDGNSIVDECAQQTPTIYSLPFIIKDTVNADFSYKIDLGCTLDTVQYFHNGANTVNSWTWNFDNLYISNQQNPTVTYNVFGNHNTQLIVSNGVCSDTSNAKIFLNNTLKAMFDASMLVCPRDPATFKDLSVANKIAGWWWDFANGNTSTLQNPPPQYYTEQPADYYAPVRLIIEDTLGCRDTTIININILHNCYIAVPSAFTPNGDGLNDYLYPVNAYKSTNMQFSVYNRLGQRIFYSTDWKVRWDGKFKGQEQDPGTYVWMLDYFNTQTGKHVFQKGTTVLIR